jgi:chloramphenicol 3-O phosphotransferase
MKISKKILIVFLASFSIASSGLFAEKGRIVIITGTSSSGKSTIIRKLMPKLGAEWLRLAIDDLSEEDLEEAFDTETPMPIPNGLGEENTLICEQIKNAASHGINIVCDTVLDEDEDKLATFVRQLSGFECTTILIQCSLEDIVQRVTSRKDRPLASPLKQFSQMYISSPVGSPKTPSSFSVSLQDVRNGVCDSPKLTKEFGSERGREQFAAGLLTDLQLGESPGQHTQVLLSPKQEYDLIINNVEGTTPEQHARTIHTFITNQMTRGFIPIASPSLYTQEAPAAPQ